MAGAAILVTPAGAGADAIGNAAIGMAQKPDLSGGVPLAVADLVFNGTSWDRAAKASAVARLPSAGIGNSATLVKNAPGTIYGIEALNASAAVKYLKIYNKAAIPGVGVDIPFRTIAIPPNNGRVQISFNSGLYCSIGIGFGLSGAAADADATALAAGDVVGLNIDYS